MRLPFEEALGVCPRDYGTADVRVWAPAASAVAFRRAGEDWPLADAGYGTWTGTVPAGPGDDYWIVVDGDPWPDPCSRWQPEGLKGPSRVVDPARFVWTDAGWTGVALDNLVVYELHVGTFTAKGTFDAAAAELAVLAELGITAVEVMPVAEFPGARGWGYDGVYQWAAQSTYGGPEGLARFVDAAHQAGLAVLLDVVHNHVGASGTRALEAFGPYFTSKYQTPWGGALNYDDAGSGAVREWALQSAEWWVGALHLDGLRLDALHAIVDESARHLVAELTDRVRAVRPGALVIAESGLNDPKVVRPERRGGWGCDAMWADDFHHSLRVLLTGEQDGWYAEFGTVTQLAKAFRRPHVHDGTWSSFRGRRFGAPASDVPAERFVVFAQDHDQVGNRALGDRLPPEARPLAALCVLVSPFTPMLFMGEEYGENAPFQFFSDHIDPYLADATREGRRAEFATFASFSGQEVPDPQDPATFERSKLTRVADPDLAELYRRLLALRPHLPSGDADEIRFDEDARWLVVRRGSFTLAANFAAEARTVPGPTGELVAATHAGVHVTDGGVVLPARAGALTQVPGLSGRR